MDKKIKTGVIVIAVGLVSLIVSIKSFITDYEIWKANGGNIEVELAPVPTWILVWMNVSFVFLVFGVILLLVAFVKARKTTVNYDDYVDVPRRKYGVDIVLIVVSALVSEILFLLPLGQWYVDAESMSVLFVGLVLFVVSLVFFLVGSIRFGDALVINSRIDKVQQKPIV